MHDSYTERRFSVAEAAQVTKIPESQIRSWLARLEVPFVGQKIGSRVLFSARDMVVMRIAGDLFDCGFPPAVALRIGLGLTGDLSPRPIPAGQFAMVGRVAIDADGEEVGHWNDFDEPTRTAIAVPLGRLAEDTLAAAEALRKH